MPQGDRESAGICADAGFQGVIEDRQWVEGSGQILGDIVVQGTINPTGSLRSFEIDEHSLTDSAKLQIVFLGGS